MGNCFSEQDYAEDRYRKAHYRDDQQRRDSRHFSQQSGGPWNEEEPPRHRYIDEREYMGQKYRRNDDPNHFDPYAPVPSSRHTRPQADGWDRDEGGPSDHVDRFTNQERDLMSDRGGPPTSIGGGDLSGSIHNSRISKSRNRYQPNEYEIRSNRGGAMDYRESKSVAREPSMARHSDITNSAQATHEAYISPRPEQQKLHEKHSFERRESSRRTSTRKNKKTKTSNNETVNHQENTEKVKRKRSSIRKTREDSTNGGADGEDESDAQGRHPLYPFEQHRTSHPAPQHDMPRKKSLHERITHYRSRKTTEEKNMGHYKNSEHEYRQIIRDNSMKRSSEIPEDYDEDDEEDDEDESFDFGTNGRKKSLQQRVEEFKNRRKHSQVRFEDESESQAEARNNQHRPETMRNHGYEDDRHSRPRRGTRGNRGANDDTRGGSRSERRPSEDMGQPPRKNSRVSKNERSGGRKSLNKNSREQSGDGSPGSRSNKRKNSTSKKNSPVPNAERGRSSERRNKPPRKQSNTNSIRSKNNNAEGDARLDLKERIARRSRTEQPQEFVLHE